MTPLHLASYNCDKNAVKLFVLNGANLNTFDDKDFTPLHYAAYRCNDLEIIELLIKNGADIDIKRNQSPSPLGLAKSLDPMKKRKEITALLIKYRSKN